MQHTIRQVRAYQACSQQILRQMAREMSAVPFSCSLSQVFIRQMLPHHKAAIALSRNVLRYTQDPQLQNIARSLIQEQTKNVEQLKAIYRRCRCSEAALCQVQRYQQQSAQIICEMVRCMQQPMTGCIACDFIRRMRPHDKGAVLLCQAALDVPLCQPLVPLLDQIITSQCRGIEQMQALARALDC